jgi:hypothetical protein
MKRALLLMVLISALSACGGGDTKRRLQILDRSIDEYAQAMRWARYQDAEAFHKTRDGEAQKLDLEALKHVRVTGYAIRSRNIDVEVQEADIEGDLQYFLDSRGTLQRTPLKQKWWYEEKSRRWFLESEPPRFLP